ncbi:class I SAM-dependent methyltransferase [Arenibaculum sp.]|jgi:hypothetical protein|uniref:class I SAM-dependent methyltransferase n=1 Tax=Arenibaculum sp. TaxID=2865862 RepID=UPI002E13EF2B|nr:class I SAM-dependent methyltransferase [Arenibaculum sp.]
MQALKRVGVTLVRSYRDWQEERSRRSLLKALPPSVFANRPPDALDPDWYDLGFLYRSVRERGPTTVLEFGSGCSTAVIAQALVDNRTHARFVSLETSEHWAEVTRSSLSPEHARICTVVHAPPVESMHDGAAVWRHANLPDIAPDFVYLDGPPLTVERPVAVDLLDLEATMPSGCLVVVDGRRRNAEYLRDHFERSWSYRWDVVADRATLELAR